MPGRFFMDKQLHEFRLLRSGEHDAFYNMGLDQAILESVSRGTAAPTLRFYSWKPAAVSIGYFQGLEEEVDLAECQSKGIDVVRRITGGGAVFHQYEVTYSIVMKEDHVLAGKTILESYERLCRGIIAGLSLLGIEAFFSPINDIISGGKKISGNAQTRKMGTILQHGTILLDTDLELMFDILKVSREKNKGRLIEDAKQRVSSLSSILGRDVPYEETEEALISGFKEALGLEYIFPAGPNEDETARAMDLAESHFVSPGWTRKRL